MSEQRIIHDIFIKRGKDKKIKHVNCYTCNGSWPSVESFLKDHLNVDIMKVPEQEYDFACCICNLEIKKEEIPKEYFEKISMQLLYHNDCINIQVQDKQDHKH